MHIFSSLTFYRDQCTVSLIFLYLLFLLLIVRTGVKFLQVYPFIQQNENLYREYIVNIIMIFKEIKTL